ncbi:hypothetical protein HIM_03827 [Hirsutella minnesotensis 3608]|uniref:BZIP domain-containing protein n=1 Tax=Hirsutella minnesotensis 3608 TaxID=1043627 RepID=A0A0F7ZQB3_9HYPO|nr:hypothetical protein HIM_03827 [Hirsutella minnesotensis 3608]
MPRKFRTPESAAQNRESQRQSRARRKQLVQDLQTRLEEYERRGTAASLEMQTAARVVKEENMHLRNLLQSHGVSGEDIDSYLAAQRSSSQAVDEPPPCEREAERMGFKSRGSPLLHTNRENVMASSVFASETAAFARSADQREPHRPMAINTPAANPSLYVHSSAQDLKIPDVVGRDTGVGSTWNESLGQSIKKLHGCHPDHPSSYATQEYPNGHETIQTQHEPSPPTFDSFETSCDVAAAILVSFHGQTDHVAARAALGCKGISNCSVRNTKVFELMDGLD